MCARNGSGAPRGAVAARSSASRPPISNATSASVPRTPPLIGSPTLTSETILAQAVSAPSRHLIFDACAAESALAGIDPTVTEIEAGRLPPGAVEALNSFDEASWSGPAPPAGSRHTYVFTLYALPSPSGVTAEMPGQEAIDLLSDGATATAKLRGEYETPS